METALEALQIAKKALAQGDKQTARRWAMKAIELEPGSELPWLFLAGLSSPKASLFYLKNALEVNPKSTRARQAMHWAIQRWRAIEPNTSSKRKLISDPITPESFATKRPALLPWVLCFLIILTALSAWLWTPNFSHAFQPQQESPQAQRNYSKATQTFTPTNSVTPSTTPTPTLTPTSTFTPTPTPTATNTPLPTATPQPTNTPNPNIIAPSSPPNLPVGVDKNERWFDLNLSEQRLYAYQGQEIVKTFVVSTGTWVHPTVTGVYNIYVKYRYAHMSGPGYYLPNVPYVMYFYKGYGIHGTYWHNNFGTPMSHGCVNLRTPDAKWAFNWAYVGTTISIHY